MMSKRVVSIVNNGMLLYGVDARCDWSAAGSVDKLARDLPIAESVHLQE